MTAAAPVPELAGTEDQPQARIVLSGALAAGTPSHAYLFHGPSGTGKRSAARALAAELLAEGDRDPGGVRRRVAAGTHPDLTWVVPTGAHVMRVDDVAEAVVTAATLTPFEARRRVFVLERAETMNDEVANRLLKTLEAPPDYVHLILLTDAPGRLLETVVSRCQPVRFDPLPATGVAAALEREGVPADRALACARLALGDGARARRLASAEGEGLRAHAEAIVADALAGERRDPAAPEAWRAVLERAEERSEEVLSEAEEAARERLEFEPKGRSRQAVKRELDEAAKRAARRARTEVLDMVLTLAAVGFRDLACAAEGADEAVLAADRLPAEATGRDPRRLREASERCEQTRQSLELNVGEELALSALGFRLAGLVGAPA